MSTRCEATDDPPPMKVRAIDGSGDERRADRAAAHRGRGHPSHVARATEEGL